MKLASDLIRAITSIIAGIALIGLMPRYSEPFVGCQSHGFATLELGCSLWPDFFLGLASALVVGLIGPERFRPPRWGLAFVTVVAVLGGPEAVRSGMLLDLFRPAEMIFYWRGPGSALWLGGLLGGAALSCVLRRLKVANLKGGGDGKFPQ
jgi:hypothetical protein